MLGLFYILLFWLIGNALSILTGGYVSGNIIGSYRVILDNLWAIVISGIVSTIVVLLVTGQTFQSLNRRSRLRRIRHLRETAPNTPDHD